MTDKLTVESTPDVPFTVRCIHPTKPLMLTCGKQYTVLSVEKEWYRIVDDSGDDYLYPSEMFEIIKAE